MLKQMTLLGAMALMSAPALAGDFQTICVQSGQGNVQMVQVPTTPNGPEQPYALTGAAPVGNGNMIGIRTGQGDLVWVKAGDRS